MTTESQMHKTDSIMSLSPINENLNNSQHLINVTDFASANSARDQQSTAVAAAANNNLIQSQDCSQLLTYGTATPAERHNTTSPTKKHRQQKTIKDIKLADMHMKRRAPQLYLSSEVRDGQKGKMNDFNSQLKKSLLTPRKHRYIATKHEQELMERASLSPKSPKMVKKPQTKQLRDMSINEGGILPIISVGSSIGSVEYQDQKLTAQSEILSLDSNTRDN